MADIQAIAENVKRDAGWLTFAGIVTVIGGVLAIAMPFVAGVAVTTFVGVFLVVGGLLRVWFGFKAQSWGGTIVALLLGVLMTAAGVLMVAQPMVGLASITLFLAAYFLVAGIFEVMLAFELKGNTGWVWMLFGGIVSVMLSFMLYSNWPLSGAWAVGTLFGVHLLFAGMAQLSIGSAAKTVAGRVAGA
jgi:uncharacterized membrane protein HdeD (DUF308 family)